MAFFSPKIHRVTIRAVTLSKTSATSTVSYSHLRRRRHSSSGQSKAARSMTEPAENTTQTAAQATQQPLVMQIVVRRDLLEAEGWGVGPLMAQVAHATSAVLHEARERPETQAYLDDLKNMRKVVMQTNDRASIERLASLLSACDPPVPHHLWVEQPENVPTCLALAPNRRESKIKKMLDKSGCRLWKG